MKKETLKNVKDTLTESYEALRDFAVYHRINLAPPQGLALFLRQGMPGWMEAWSSLASYDRDKAASLQPLGTSIGCAGSPPSEAAVILASMALATIRRGNP